VLFRQGHSFTVAPYKVLYLFNTEEAAALRAGFTVSSRTFKKAVDRNRIKRLTKEAYRINKLPLLNHLQAHQLSMSVFFLYTGKELPEYQQVTKKIELILQRLTNIVHEKAALRS
jgi:ribonuclease P protein component